MYWLDYFVHVSLKTDTERLFRARVLVGIIFTYLLIQVFTILYILTVAPLSTPSAHVSAVVVFVMQWAYLGVLLLLKYAGHYKLCAHCTVMMTAFGVVAAVVIAGGPVKAPAIAIGIMPIILAFVLAGRSAGLLWTQIMLVLHASMIVINKWWYPFPALLNFERMEIHHSVTWLINYSAIMGLMVVFENINQRLKKERDAERERFAYLAAHDPLTHLANRTMFNDRLQKALDRADRFQASVGLLFIDLDNFKPINDQMGHDTGDRVLRIISARLLNKLRKADTVARLGGDEFAIIVESVEHTESVCAIADKVMRTITAPIEDLAGGLVITASIGIASYPTHARSSKQLVKAADIAMYRAKIDKNTWQVYEPRLEPQAG